MKKFFVCTNLCFWLVVFSIFMLNGCVGGATQVQYEHSAPPEKACTLNINFMLKVKQFDGQDVSWQPKGLDLWVTVQVPEGSHTMLFDYHNRQEVTDPSRMSPGNPMGVVKVIHHTLNNVTVSYDNFQAGHTYQIFTIEDRWDTPSLRVALRDITNNPSPSYFDMSDCIWLPLH